jgi:quinol-cytochrome oxidoreductase complex cytochrome b subunit
MTIDWIWLAENFLWILGLALALSVYSFSRMGRSPSRAAFYTLLAGQGMTLLGLVLSRVEWRWMAVAGLWILWTLFNHFFPSKDSHPAK